MIGNVNAILILYYRFVAVGLSHTEALQWVQLCYLLDVDDEEDALILAIAEWEIAWEDD